MKTLNLILFMWFVLGSVYLVYAQDIDGRIINRPVTYGVDTQDLKTDKAAYRPGETVSVYFSFCRHRSFTALSQWKLVDDVVTTYAASSHVLSAECVVNKLYPIGVIPPDAIKGTHHLEGETQIQINPLNNVYVNYRSQNFEVI